MDVSGCFALKFLKNRNGRVTNRIGAAQSCTSSHKSDMQDVLLLPYMYTF